MGALRQTFLTKHHQVWRLFASSLLHVGVFHLIINLSSVIFVGIHLEQEFGPRTTVTSSSALFGLLGAMLSGLLLNLNFYGNKFPAAIVAILSISVINLMLGLLPYVNNFANIGGFISGFLLGFVMCNIDALDSK